MHIKIYPKNLINMLIIIGSLMVVQFSKSYTILSFVLVSYVCVGILFQSLKRKKYMYLICIGLVYENLTVMTFLTKVIDMAETSWRRQYTDSIYVDSALRLISISLLIICLIYYVCSINKLSNHVHSTMRALNVNNTIMLAYSIFCIVYMVIYVQYGGFLTVRNYAQQGNSQIISLYRIFQAAYIVIFFSRGKKGSIVVETLYRTVLSLFVALDMITGIMGYRFILVELAFFIFFINIENIKAIKLRYLILIAIVILLGYLGLTMIRNTSIDSSNLLECFFKHERNIFYSLVAIIQNDSLDNTVNTYVNTLANILPGNVGAVSANTGQILLPYIRGNASFAEGLTMGGFYLTEAYFNMGGGGIIIISIIIALSMAWIEYKREYGCFKYTLLIYFFLAAQMYNVVYYGSSNYMKTTLFYIIFVYLYYCVENIGNIRFSH